MSGVLRIETKGTWREMGQQLGEEFKEALTECVNRYFYNRLDTKQCEPGVRKIEAIMKEHCPELIDETEGIAQAAGLDYTGVLGYRFFNEVKYFVDEDCTPQQDCSAVFLASDADGPMLARNCDLARFDDRVVQLCRVSRPTEGPASVLLSYLAMLTGSGLNEYGLAIGNASVHTTKTFGNEGIPGGVLYHLLISKCKTVADATDILSKYPCLGKGANTLIADAQGNSTLFELVAGRIAPMTPRRKDRDWQACMNHYFSPEVPNRPKPDYLQNSYARYGRVHHMLEDNDMPRSFDTIREVIREISQPGPVALDLNTGYSTIAAAKQKTLYLADGPPLKTEYEPITL